MSLHLFAGLRVRDFPAARAWYDRLLGEPTFFPHATEAVWTLAEDGSVYVVEHVDGAGNSVVTLFVEDLDEWVAAIAARGLEPDEQETYSNGVRKVVYRDPDGNEVGFGGAPSIPVPNTLPTAPIAATGLIVGFGVAVCPDLGRSAEWCLRSAVLPASRFGCDATGVERQCADDRGVTGVRAIASLGTCHRGVARRASHSVSYSCAVLACVRLQS